MTCVALAAFLHDLGKGPVHLTLAGTARNPEWKAEAKKVALAPVHMFEAVHLPAQVGATLAQLYEAWDGSGTPMVRTARTSPSGRASSPRWTAGWTSPGTRGTPSAGSSPASRRSASWPSRRESSSTRGWWRCSSSSTRGSCSGDGWRATGGRCWWPTPRRPGAMRWCTRWGARGWWCTPRARWRARWRPPPARTCGCSRPRWASPRSQTRRCSCARTRGSPGRRCW